MSNKKNETAKERLERQRKEAELRKQTGGTDLVGQLTHESDGEPDYEAITEQLKQRQASATAAKPDYVKFTMYIDRPIAEAFKAMCVQTGDNQRVSATEAFADYIKKKARELGID